MKLETKLTVFTPAEAEKITRVLVATQRDWRRRGFLPATEGHMRFNAFELGELLALKLLADRGIGPKEGKEVSDYIAAGIVRFSLQSKMAYEGNCSEVDELPRKLSVKGLREAIETKVAAARQGHIVNLSDAPVQWLASTNKVSRHVLRQHNKPTGIGKVVPGRFFLWFADGSHLWDKEIEKHFEADDVESVDVKTAGPVVVLDQFALGRLMLERAGRAFVYIEDPTGEK